MQLEVKSRGGECGCGIDDCYKRRYRHVQHRHRPAPSDAFGPRITMLTTDADSTRCILSLVRCFLLLPKGVETTDNQQMF